MKEGWEVKKLGEVMKLQSGENLPAKKMQDGIYPVYGGNGVSGYHNDYNMMGENIIIGRVGALCGNVRHLRDPFWLTDNGFKVILNKGLTVDLRYLTLFLNFANLRQYAKQTAQPVISNVALKEVPVILPPLPEQERIVSILDAEFAKIDAVKAGAEKSLQHAKDLYDKILIDKFSHKKGWVKSTLQEECYRITDGTHQTPQYYDSGYIFLSSGNVTNRKINWDNIKFVDEGQHQEMQKRVSPQLNDILLAKNGTTGVAAIVDKDVEFDIYVSLALLRTLGRIIPKYLLYFVNSPLAKKQFNKRLKGIGVPNLHLTEIRQVEISYPSEQQVQNDIVKTIEMLDEKFRCFEAIAQRTIALCDDMKQALLRKAFNGEL